MPIYNGEKYLASALDSLVEQEQNGFECIAVDDGSSDRSLDLLESYRTRLNLTIMRGDRIGNWVTCTNRGLRKARGKFVSFLHQDDLWRPNRARRLKQISEDRPDCTFFSGNADFVNAQGKNVGRWRPPLLANHVLTGATVLERLIVQDFFAINNPMFLKSRALELNGLNETLWYTADWDFWLRLMRNERIFHVKETLCAFRLHRESQTITGSSQKANDFQDQLQTVLNKHIQACPDLPDDVVERARLSAHVNITLSQAYDQRSLSMLLSLTGKFAFRTPLFQYRFFRDTGLASRVGARLRALT